MGRNAGGERRRSVARAFLLPSCVLAIVACGAPSEAAPPVRAAPSPPAEAPAAGCALEARPIASPAMSPELAAVAPQYFHASHRGGFDAYRGGAPDFPWFDVTDLEHPVRAPEGARIAASTRGTLFVASREGQLGTMRRGAGRVEWTGQRLYVVEAVESDAGDRWALARSGTTYRVVHVAPDGAVVVRDVGLSELGHDVRIALTAEGTPVLAWLAREGGHLRVHVAFGIDPAGARVVDEVELPEPVAELSERSRVDLAIAAHGPRGIGVAWRPLDDPEYEDVGSPVQPPSTPARAQVRWRVVEPSGALGEVHQRATIAHPLGFVTGIGPWPLAGNGAKAATLRGRALFVWHDEDGVYGALADDASATRLAAREGAPLIVLRPAGEALELLLLAVAGSDSSPRVTALALDCR